MTAVLADDDGEGWRLRKTIRAEFLLEHDRRRESIEAVQAALDALGLLARSRSCPADR